MSSKKIAIPVKVYWEKVESQTDSVRDVTDYSTYHKPGQVVDSHRVTVTAKPWLIPKKSGRGNKELSEIRPSTENMQMKHNPVNFVTPPGSQSSSSSSRPVTLKDLCHEDKKKVANLIQELAKFGEEKENAVEQLHQATLDFEKKLQFLLSEKESAMKEQVRLKEKLLEYQFAMKSQSKANSACLSNIIADPSSLPYQPVAYSVNDEKVKNSAPLDIETSACNDQGPATYYYLGKAEPNHFYAGERPANISAGAHMESELLKDANSLIHTANVGDKDPAMPCEGVLISDEMQKSLRAPSCNDDIFKYTLLEQQLKLQTQQRQLQQQIEQLQLLQQSLVHHNSNTTKRLTPNPFLHPTEESSKNAKNNDKGTDTISLHFSEVNEHQQQGRIELQDNTPTSVVLDKASRDAICQVDLTSYPKLIKSTIPEKGIASGRVSNANEVTETLDSSEQKVNTDPAKDQGQSVEVDGDGLPPVAAEIVRPAQVAACQSSSSLHKKKSGLKIENASSRSKPSTSEKSQLLGNITSNSSLFDSHSVSASCQTSALLRRHFQPSSVLELVDGIKPKSTSTSLRSSSKSEGSVKSARHGSGLPYMRSVSLYHRSPPSLWRSNNSGLTGASTRVLSMSRQSDVVAQRRSPIDRNVTNDESLDDSLIEDVFFL